MKGAEANVTTPQSQAAGLEPPGSVVIFVPGSMQALFDQSIGLFARQVTAACNRAIGTTSYMLEHIEEIQLASGRTFEQAKVTHQVEQRQNVVVVSANYAEMLSEKLKQSSIFMRFARLLAFLLRVTPLLYRILKIAPRRGQANLSAAHKGFLVGAYALVLLALTAAAAAAVQAIGSTPKFLVLLTIVIALFVPPRVVKATLSTGNEYYGLIRYLLYADKGKEIRKYLADVHSAALCRYPTASIHVVCFSFGCVAEFDYLFAPDLEPSPEVALSSLTFIGFPYTLIDTGEPSYFGSRRWPGEKIGRWQNLYLADDVLGSRITDYLGDMFGNPNKGIPLNDMPVAAQRQRRSWANPVIRHLAYWDPKADEPCDAILNVARAILSCQRA
jgi:hypothetical protein